MKSNRDNKITSKSQFTVLVQQDIVDDKPKTRPMTMRLCKVYKRLRNRSGKFLKNPEINFFLNRWRRISTWRSRQTCSWGGCRRCRGRTGRPRCSAQRRNIRPGSHQTSPRCATCKRHDWNTRHSKYWEMLVFRFAVRAKWSFIQRPVDASMVLWSKILILNPKLRLCLPPRSPRPPKNK